MVTAFMGLTSWRVVTVSHKLSIRTEARPIIFRTTDPTDGPASSTIVCSRFQMTTNRSL